MGRHARYGMHCGLVDLLWGRKGQQGFRWADYGTRGPGHRHHHATNACLTVQIRHCDYMRCCVVHYYLVKGARYDLPHFPVVGDDVISLALSSPLRLADSCLCIHSHFTFKRV